MKLSLTAIAALSAAFFHPTVATGTRAASTNGNTNAAEDKPHRDLASFAEFFEDIDAAFDGGFGEEKTEALLFGKVASADMVSIMLLASYGEGAVSVPERAIPVNIIQTLLSFPGDGGPLKDGIDDNGDGWVHRRELNEALIKVDLEALEKFSNIFQNGAMFMYAHGGHGGYGRN